MARVCVRTLARKGAYWTAAAIGIVVRYGRYMSHTPAEVQLCAPGPGISIRRDSAAAAQSTLVRILVWNGWSV